MFDPKSAADINYIKGFDHGCDYIVAEIERHMKETPNTEQVLAPVGGAWKEGEVLFFGDSATSAPQTEQWREFLVCLVAAARA